MGTEGLNGPGGSNSLLVPHTRPSGELWGGHPGYLRSLSSSPGTLDVRGSSPHTWRPAPLQIKRKYPQMGELAAMLEEGTLEKAAKGLWGTSSKPGRYSK